MGRYDGHTKNDNRPEAPDKKRLVDLGGIEATTSSWLRRPQQYIEQRISGYGKLNRAACFESAPTRKLPQNGCNVRERQFDRNLQKLAVPGLEVEGLSFHVGSQCTNPQTYIQALHLAAGIFEEAKTRGFDLKPIDIGGGFPAHYDATVPPFTQQRVRASLLPLSETQVDQEPIWPE